MILAMQRRVQRRGQPDKCQHLNAKVSRISLNSGRRKKSKKDEMIYKIRVNKTFEFSDSLEGRKKRTVKKSKNKLKNSDSEKK